MAASSYAHRQIPGANGLDGMSVEQFKLILGTCDYPTTGRRSELIDKICTLKTRLNMSYGELMCATVLLEAGIQFVREYECFIPGFGDRRYDFWLPKFETIIEYNGAPHFNSKYRNQGRAGLNEVRRVDVGKIKYARARPRGWKVIVIDENYYNIKGITEQIMKGLRSGSDLYLSNRTKLKYILDGLKQ